AARRRDTRASARQPDRERVGAAAFGPPRGESIQQHPRRAPRKSGQARRRPRPLWPARSQRRCRRQAARDAASRGVGLRRRGQRHAAHLVAAAAGYARVRHRFARC
nr:hypothetical protein [Tanacetum cinerariifolium]